MAEQQQSSLLYMLPLLIVCCMMPMLMRGFGQRRMPKNRETDMLVTPKKINEVYEAVTKEVESWRKEAAEAEPIRKPGFSLFKRKNETTENRFTVAEEVPPRLLRISDRAEGEIIFEFIEIEQNGTSVRISHYPPAKPRIQTFKAEFPSKAPLQWQSCPSCGKPVLPDFKTCPYCTMKLEEEPETEESNPAGEEG